MLSSLLPVSVREAAYKRKFIENPESEHLFMGSYESFEAAQANVPPGKAIGYDNAEEAKKIYSHQLYFYDYPGLFWLGRALEEGMRSVFDLGGHVGIKYYAFRRVIPYPANLHWTVCDVPGVVQTGRELAIQREVTSQLDFTTDFHDASGYDVLYAAGSLQYLPLQMSEMLAQLPVKPKRIVINTAATHPDRTLYTLNSIGFAVCPYRIQHHDALQNELVEAGYKRLDAWRNEGKPIEIPFVEGGDKAFYSGCCFDLR